MSLFASDGLKNKRIFSDVLSLSGSALVLGGLKELRVEILESKWMPKPRQVQLREQRPLKKELQLLMVW